MVGPSPRKDLEALSRLVGGFSRVVFSILILSSVYDKSGLVLGSISIAFYKILYVFLGAIYLLDPFKRRSLRGATLDRRPLLWVVTFVIVQTGASLLGALATPGPVPWSSEIYYVIQRSSFLMIPLFAFRYNVPPRRLLKLFVGSILFHYAFIAVQFASPGAYNAFVERVYNPLRADNSLGWAGGSFDFIGLQRTGNYGAFAAAFGLLLAAFRSKGAVLKGVAVRLVLGTAVLIALLSGARAVFLMVVVASFFYARKTGALSRMSNYLKAAALGLVVAGVFASGTLRPSSIGSVYAFFSEERAGSNVGKLANAEYGWQLFQQSPLVGFGQRRFADLTLPLGNDSPSQAESHSFVLSTVLSSGLVGWLVYVGMCVAIVKALWSRPGRDCAIVCALFIGLNLYNIVYDAAALDIFACFNGVVAYYALYSRRTPGEVVKN